MADVYSVEGTKITGTDRAPLSTRESAGRVRMAYFSYTTVTGAAQNDKLYCAVIPAYARILEGRLYHGALGTSVTLDFGIEGKDGDGTYDGSTSDDADFFTSAALDVAAAGETSFNNLNADPGKAYETNKEVWLTATFLAADPDADISLEGYLLYVAD